MVNQDPYFKFDHITVKDGLSNNKVLDIFQDKYGFIWIGTIDGLNKYNGYDIESFRHDPADSSSISGNLITSITEDIYGNLWIGTKTGLNKYDLEKNGFLRFNYDEKTGNLSDEFVRALFADRNGVLWIETADGALHKYDVAMDSLSKYKHRKPKMLNTYFYHTIFKDKRGYLWLGGREMGILKFDPDTDTFHEVLPDPEDPLKKRNNDVATYHIDSSGNFWIGGLDGLYTFTEAQENFEKLLPVSTYSIQEDRNGKLWFGTGSGIYLYEKSNNSLIHYIHSDNNPTSLIDNHVNKIISDHSGNIWIGTNEGISIFSPTKNKFALMYHIPGNEGTPVSNNITALIQDKHGNIWMGTANDGIDCFDKNFNKIAHYGSHEPRGYKIITDKISVLIEDHEGDIWAGQWSGRGFNIIDPVTHKIGSYSRLTNSLSADWYNDLMQDSRGNFWIGIWGNTGLYQFDKQHGVFKDETFTISNIGLSAPVLDIVIENELVWFGPVRELFPAYNTLKGKINMYFLENSLWHEPQWINQVFLDSENRLWFASSNGLYEKINNPYILFRLYEHDITAGDSRSQNIQAISNSFNKHLLWVAGDNGIELFNKETKKYKEVCDYPDTGVLVNFLYHDIDGRLWIGSQSGLYFKPSEEKRIYKYSDPELPGIEPAETAVYCYLAEPSGDFWLGAASGLYYWSHQNKLFSKNNVMNGYEVYSMVSDLFGDFWIGSDKGLHNIRDNNIIESHHYSDTNQNTLAGDTVYSLAAQSNGDLWIGTEKGLCRLDKAGGNITRFGVLEDKYISSRLTSCLYEDREGSIWVGTTELGLNKLNPVTGVVKQFISDLNDSTAFWGKDVSCIMQTADGSIWAGGYGLNKYIPENNTFIHYTETEGLANNDVMGMLDDNSGNLWISTKNGLSKFDYSSGIFENYYTKDGLQDGEFTYACCKLSNDYLMFGGKNGLNIFNPENIRKNHHRPEVSISRFMIFDEDSDYEFPQTKSIELKHKQNYFSFEFAALDYSYPAENKYAYVLENFDPEWFYTDANDRRAKYTNVPPGEYIFRVKAANNDGTWNEAGASVSLIVKPPFWKTWWFYSLEGLLIVLIIISYIKYREKKINEKNKLLLLEQKLLRSQMNPHFIFNSLTSIQSFIFENNLIEAGSYLSKFSELIRSILYNSREEFIPLEKEINTLENYLNIQQLRYNNKFDYEIEVDHELDPELHAVPPMLAQPFIENSVEHGIRHLEGRGTISVKFQLAKESIILIIEDNGIGMEASGKIHSEKAREHKSLALIITQERIGVLNKGKRNKPYGMHIEDRVGADESIEGTRVTLIIPFTKHEP